MMLTADTITNEQIHELMDERDPSKPRLTLREKAACIAALRVRRRAARGRRHGGRCWPDLRDGAAGLRDSTASERGGSLDRQRVLLQKFA